MVRAKNIIEGKENWQTFSLTGFRKKKKEQLKLVGYIQATNCTTTLISATFATVLTLFIHPVIGLPLCAASVSTTEVQQ